MKGNIKLELKTLTPSGLRLLLAVVTSKLEESPYFPAPPVPFAELKQLVMDYTNSISDATEGSRLARSHRNTLTVKVRNVLRLLANYVRMVAQGNEVILTSSGFSLVKEPSASRTMEAPQMKGALMTGRVGEVQLRWSGVRNRRAYHVSMTEGDPSRPDTQWNLVAVTGKITHRVKGLVPYKPYWFRVSAIGALGVGVQSGAIIGRAA